MLARAHAIADPPAAAAAKASAATLTLPLFAAQVAGRGALAVLDAAGGVLAKPCLPAERDFYRAVAAAADPPSPLLRFLPPFLGEHDPRHGAVRAPAPKFSCAIRLANVVAGLHAPCILDVKVGSQLHDPNASPERRLVKQRAALATTSGTAGLRVSGMRLHRSDCACCRARPSHRGCACADGDGSGGDCEYDTFGKEYGRALTAATVHAAFLDFTRDVAPPSERIAVLARMRDLVADLLAVAERLDGAVFVRTSLLFAYSASAPSPASTVQMHWIDFAHADLATGTAGPDAQFLFGLRNTVAAISAAICELTGGDAPETRI
ncbi:hypothetical protein H9P43_002821 [Blastocladiella emersonii ATCC 22665]|nr:hypothetical protein H9P43_010154 [Blastocladiella emersonii ATCC 22665]KAI9188430.1 hypothetical protein H9P43_002821 [Blastocladiella emersonii ATCC 22665]